MVPRSVEILTYTCRVSHSDHWKTVMVPLGNTVIALSNLEDLKKTGWACLPQFLPWLQTTLNRAKEEMSHKNTWWFTSQLLRAGKSRTRKDRNHLKEQHEDWNSNCQFVDEYCLYSLRQPCHEGIGKGFHVTPFYSKTKKLVPKARLLWTPLSLCYQLIVRIMKYRVVRKSCRNSFCTRFHETYAMTLRKYWR